MSSLGPLLSPILGAVLQRTVSWKLQQAEKEGKSRKEGQRMEREGRGWGERTCSLVIGLGKKKPSRDIVLRPILSGAGAPICTH